MDRLCRLIYRERLNNMKINFALARILKEHAMYAIALLLFIGMLAVLSAKNIQSIVETNKKIDAIKIEIGDLQKQNDTIVRYSPEDLDALVRTINRLLPSNEDYFSIFNSLEVMGANTGVSFTSFSSPFSGTSTDGVLVSAEASGTVSSFLNFLEQYQLAGTRVATVEDITINPPASTAIFRLKFHSKAVSTNGLVNTVPAINEKMVQLLQKIEARDGSISPIPDENQPEILLESKEDPFSQ